MRKNKNIGSNQIYAKKTFNKTLINEKLYKIKIGKLIPIMEKNP